MINQVVANPDYSSSTNQYGFYALPKTVKPKSKYREDSADYESEQNDSRADNGNNILVPLSDQPEDERTLERDYFVDEAPWADFKRKEPGLDYGVQVEDQQLFDFDREVEPLLQILVGRSILKARNELQEEQEKQEARAKLTQFQKKRNAELMVTQRLEAKHVRKVEQAERRVLQHKIYKEQKKLTVRKIIAYNEAKRALAGLRNEVLQDLESEGFLRHDPIINLRTQFTPWLYQEILQSLESRQALEAATSRLLTDDEDELRKKHKEHQNKEQKRRKEILDQRERERLENEERKRKKAIRKHRKQLNAARIDKDNKLFDIIGKGEKVENILKAELSDNIVKTKNAVYLSGGIVVQLLEILQALETLKVRLTDEQIEDLIIKTLSQLAVPLEISLNSAAREAFANAERDARQNVVEFHSRREEIINSILATQLPNTQPAGLLNYELVRILGKKLDSSLVQALIRAFLNIYFVYPAPEPKPVEPTGDAPPAEDTGAEAKQPEVTPTFVLTEREKQRLQVKQNLQVNFQQASQTSVNSITDVVRVRFPRVRPQQEEEDPADAEYIQIYDGEGWQRTTKKYPQRRPESERSAVSLNFTGFQKLFVYDEIADYYFQVWVYSALQKIIGGSVKLEELLEQMRRMQQAYERITESLHKDNMPIFDIEAQQ